MTTAVTAEREHVTNDIVAILALLLTAEEALRDAQIRAMALAGRLKADEPELANGFSYLAEHIGEMEGQDPTIEHARLVVSRLLIGQRGAREDAPGETA
jgi:hypothetical protein